MKMFIKLYFRLQKKVAKRRRNHPKHRPSSMVDRLLRYVDKSSLYQIIIFIIQMTKEELEEHLGRIREELDREREERNYFQLERDRISTFWEITKRQLEEKKAELRNKDRELEDAEEQHQAEIKVGSIQRRTEPLRLGTS
jgi:hypothetical protein